MIEQPEIKKRMVSLVYHIDCCCGTEKIDNIFFDKKDAQLFAHKQNIEWVKYMGSWDGSTCEYYVITKNVPLQLIKNEFGNGYENLDYDNCDDCGRDCKCTLKTDYKTESIYKNYWREERKFHNHNHSPIIGNKPVSDCLYCKEDLLRIEQLEKMFV